MAGPGWRRGSSGNESFVKEAVSETLLRVPRSSCGFIRPFVCLRTVHGRLHGFVRDQRFARAQFDSRRWLGACRQSSYYEWDGLGSAVIIASSLSRGTSAYLLEVCDPC
jgi:hypothetical protein